MKKEPNFSKNLRELMRDNLGEYPFGMVCTGSLSITEPNNTTHTTFGGFRSEDDFHKAITAENSVNQLKEAFNLLSDMNVIFLLNTLIIEGPQPNQSQDFINKLLGLSFIETIDNQIEITGKGRTFILANYSLIA